MVLSAVLQTSWSADVDKTLNIPPTTWVDTLGGVRSLQHHWTTYPDLPRKRKPPIIHPTIDGEGQKKLKPVINQLSVKGLAGLKNIGATRAMATTLPKPNPSTIWSDTNQLVGSLACCVIRRHSFGLIGLLADNVEVQAVVDTGASMTVTSYRDDFITYAPLNGRVLKEWNAGANIPETGLVHWQVE